MLHQQFEPVAIQAGLMLELLFRFARLIHGGLGALQRGAILFHFLGGRGILRRQLRESFLLPLQQVLLRLRGFQIGG